MNKEIKQKILLISFGVIFFTGLSNFDAVLQFISKIINIAMPLIIGGIIAFILTVPANAYERLLMKLSKKCKKPLSGKTINILSMILTFISLLLIIAIVMLIVIPEISNSVKMIVIQIKEQWPTWQVALTEQGFNTETITKYLEATNAGEYTPKIFNLLSSAVSTIAGTTLSVISVTINIIFSLMATFYFLLFRKGLARGEQNMVMNGQLLVEELLNGALKKCTSRSRVKFFSRISRLAPLLF